MTSQINPAIPATNAPLVSAVIRQQFTTAASEITALQNYVPVSGGIAVPPAPIPGVSPPAPKATSRIGLNIYADSTGWHYVDNGPGAVLGMQTSDPVGSMAPMSRLSIAIADINTAGPGAGMNGPEGIINISYGPQGGGITNGYVVIGSAMDLLPVAPFYASLIANQIAIAPGQSPTRGATARLGMNLYLASDDQYRYIGNGPAGIIGMQSTNPVSGVSGSRISIAVADINASGGGAVANPEGVINVTWGPQGSPSGQAYVSIGNAMDLLPFPPYFASLSANEFIIAPGQAGPIGATARVGLNMYLATDNTYRYVNNGPAAQIGMQSGGGTMSRLSFGVCDVGTAGAGTPVVGPVGILNLCYGPAGGGTSNAFVVVGAADRIPSFNPPRDSLLCDVLFLSQQQVLIGPAGSGPGGSGRALYLA